MIYYYINSTDRSDDVDWNSLKISDEIQQKVNTAQFSLFDGDKPSEGESIEIYDGTTIVSASGTSIVYNDDDGNIEEHNIFRGGDVIWLGIDQSTSEQVTVSSVDLTTQTITLSSAMSNSHNAGEQVGKKIFAGNIWKIKDRNLRTLSNIEYYIDCIDYTKIFDRKLINDTWQGKTALYIINQIVNDTINYNHLIDQMEYSSDAAIQAEWIESDDGDNPTSESADYKEETYAGVFPWTNSGGTATWEGTPASRNISDLTGANSGAPTDGKVCFWYKQTDNTTVTNIKIRIGSDSSNYTEVTLTPESDNNWHYTRLLLSEGSETGTPDWTACDYCAIVVTETGSSNVIIDGLRINETNCFTFENVETGLTYDDFRCSFKKPTTAIERLAKESGFFWYIDYERDIHFFDIETKYSPFDLSNTSNNFNDLQIEVDLTQLKNRQVVRGGTETSSNRYEQTFKGDGFTREWLLKTKFVTLTCSVDTGGGATAQTIGIENINDEASYDYFSNYNEKSVRSAATTSTLSTTSTISFSYYEVIPIRVQVTDPVSVTMMKSLVGGDGIFDGAPITNQNIKRREEAQQIAAAEIDRYGNAVLTAKFTTNQYGLKAGQIINIEDTTGSRVSRDFLIQKVKQGIKAGHISEFSVTAASSIYGIVEFLQQLLKRQGDLEIDENEIIENVIDVYESVSVTEAFVETTPFNTFSVETVTISETVSYTETTSNFVWAGAGGNELRWNLGAWAS